MSYKLRFHELALHEWQKLDNGVKELFKKKLAERMQEPRIVSAALSGMADCYKIKLRQAGFRLIYKVDENFVTVLAIGKRERLQAYESAKKRF